MPRLAALAGYAIAALLLVSAQEVTARKATSRADVESEQGACLVQRSFARLFHGGISLLTDKPGEEHARVKAANASVESDAPFEDAVPGSVPPEVPLAIKVQDTAKNGTETVLVGPAWNLLMELHVPMRLRDLHTGKYGPMKTFLDTLSKALVAAGPVSKSRLVMLDVRGENRNFSLHSLDLLELELGLISFPTDKETDEGSQSERGSSTGSGSDSKETGSDSRETVIDIEVLPMEHPGDAPPAELLAAWQAQLADRRSELRQGRLSAPLQGATLVRVGPPLPADGSRNRWGTVVKSGARGPARGARGLAAGALLAVALSLC